MNTQYSQGRNSSKKLFAIILATIFLLVSISPQGVNAATKIASDTKNHWAKNEISSWQSEGLLKGDDAGNVRPNDKITRAEFMAFVNRMENYTETSEEVKNFKDVKETDWFYKPISVALKAGYIKGVGEDKINPNGKITRQEAMAILSRIAGLDSRGEAYRKAEDGNVVSDWAKVPVSACIESGFVSGNKGMIRPRANITRAEAVVMLNRKMTDVRTFGLAGTYDLKNKEVENIYVSADGVTLKNAKIKNDLTITESVGDGDVYLDNVAIEKDLYAYGGGEHSLHFASITVKGTLIVKKVNGKIRVVVSGNTKAKVTILQSGAVMVNETKDGKAFGETIVVEEAANAKIELKGAFDKVVNEAKGTEIKLDGKVKKIEFKEEAKLNGEKQKKNTKLNNTDSTEPKKTEKKSGGGGGGGSSHAKTEPKVLQSIRVTSQPKKLTYVQGEELALDGIKVEGTYKKGSNTIKENLTVQNANVTGFNKETVGQQTLTVTISGKTATFEVEVVAPIPTESKLKSIGQLQDINIENGTSLDDIKAKLPASVSIVYTVGTDTTEKSGVATLDWTNIDFTSYDVNKKEAHSITLKAVVTLDSKMTNPSAVTLEAPVTVNVTPKKWDVTFVVEGTSEVTYDAQKITHGEKAIKPAVKPVTDYDFQGFKTTSGGTTDFDFTNTAIQENVTIYAIYKEKTTTGGNSNYVDPRFAEGYPKIELLESENKVKIKYKMKDASKENPYEVFVARRYINEYMSWDETEVEALLRGIRSYRLQLDIETNYIKIENVEEVALEVDIHFLNDLITSFGFVVRDKEGNVSNKITRIDIDKEVEEEIDTRGPVLSSNSNALINDNRTKIVMFIFELDERSVPDIKDFKFTGNYIGTPEIKSIKIEDGYPSKTVLEVSGIEDITDMKLQYISGDKPFQDTNKNKMRNFEIPLEDIEPKIEIEISENKKNLLINIFGLEEHKNVDVEVSSNKGIRFNEVRRQINTGSTHIVKQKAFKAEEKLDANDEIRIKVNNFKDALGDLKDPFELNIKVSEITNHPILRFKEATFDGENINIDVKTGNVFSSYWGEYFEIHIGEKVYKLTLEDMNSFFYHTEKITTETIEEDKKYSYYYQGVLPEIKKLKSGDTFQLIYTAEQYGAENFKGIRDEMSVPYLEKFDDKKVWEVTVP